MNNSDIIGTLHATAKQHKKQERYHRRRAQVLMQQVEVLCTELGIKLEFGTNNKGVTADARNKYE